MKRTAWFAALALLPAMAMAQSAMAQSAMAQGARLKLPDFSGLAGKAKESVDISLDGDTLKMAGGFLGGNKSSDAEFSEALKTLQGIYVKVFSFDQPGMYSVRDIESVVTQVEKQGWSKLMSVRDKDERVEMWLKMGNADGGMLFVSTEPTELVLINIVGKVDLQTLAKLQGRMGVPMLPGVPGIRPPAPPAPPAPAARAAPAAPAAQAAPAAPPPPAAPAAPKQL